MLGGLAPAEFAGAPCAADPDLFFADTAETDAAAKAICAGCPFRAPCLAWALTMRLPYGVAGGLSATERRQSGPRACPRCGAAAPARRVYCGDICAAAARADSRAMQAEMRAARRLSEQRRRAAALHTVGGGVVTARLSVPRRWPLFLIGLPAGVAVWSGWVALGSMCGFGLVHPLPGIAPHVQLNTAITLPVGVEAYGAYALGAWLTVPAAPRRNRGRRQEPGRSRPGRRSAR